MHITRWRPLVKGAQLFFTILFPNSLRDAILKTGAPAFESEGVRLQKLRPLFSKYSEARALARYSEGVRLRTRGVLFKHVESGSASGGVLSLFSKGLPGSPWRVGPWFHVVPVVFYGSAPGHTNA